MTRRPILLPGPTDPRFWFALWGALLAGLAALGIVAIVRASKEIAEWSEADPFSEPWGDL